MKKKNLKNCIEQFGSLKGKTTSIISSENTSKIKGGDGGIVVTIDIIF